MAKPPESTRTSLRQRLAARAAERWPQLAGITVRYRGEFAYVDGQLADGCHPPEMCDISLQAVVVSLPVAPLALSDEDRALAS